MNRKMSFVELINKNKEDLLKDKKQVAKIEERLDERHVKPEKHVAKDAEIKEDIHDFEKIYRTIRNSISTDRSNN